MSQRKEESDDTVIPLNDLEQDSSDTFELSDDALQGTSSSSKQKIGIDFDEDTLDEAPTYKTSKKGRDSGYQSFTSDSQSYSLDADESESSWETKHNTSADMNVTFWSDSSLETGRNCKEKSKTSQDMNLYSNSDSIESNFSETHGTKRIKDTNNKIKLL